MVEKKKIVFYSLLSYGHFNVCVSLAKAMLDKHSDKVEIYFVCDKQWEEKLKKMDDRFKMLKFEYETKAAENRLDTILESYKQYLEMPTYLDRLIAIKKRVTVGDTKLETDSKVEKLLHELSPDFLLCDQFNHLPSMQGFQYGFILSANPLSFGFAGYPAGGVDIGIDETERIKEVDELLKESRLNSKKQIEGYFLGRGMELPKDVKYTRPLSKHFSIYTYPAELEYYPENLRKEHNLWQIDSPVLPSRVPKPYELPEDFKALPGKIVYVSLGSVFSAYTERMQRMINILDKLEHKFIISKGPKGDQLVFPSKKFIGENYIDQLAVLQVVDGCFITHGGNNSFCESFHFGVTQIVTGIAGDQINNQKHIEETGYGFALNFTDYTENELISKVEKAINDNELKAKLAKISQRIQRENKINQVADKVVEYVEKL